MLVTAPWPVQQPQEARTRTGPETIEPTILAGAKDRERPRKTPLPQSRLGSLHRAEIQPAGRRASTQSPCKLRGRGLAGERWCPGNLAGDRLQAMFWHRFSGIRRRVMSIVIDTFPASGLARSDGERGGGVRPGGRSGNEQGSPCAVSVADSPLELGRLACSLRSGSPPRRAAKSRRCERCPALRSTASGRRLLSRSCDAERAMPHARRT